jgi:hypothetical protein
VSTRELDFEKIQNKGLIDEWLGLLTATEDARRKFVDILNALEGDSYRDECFEAVKSVSESRDRERAFFWSSFTKN